ncbi:MAG: peptide chain release factor N(5)-glutamine methyltransferase [Candidatus Omnitrophica bacterium]|nr:peptide chain release factor N(5)-glutamine methyltransferase [Candidatus Omnitrophota bacterium]
METLLLDEKRTAIQPRAVFSWAVEYLKTHGIERPEADAGWLMESAFGFSKIDIFRSSSFDQDPVKKQFFLSLLKKRAQRYPVQYCLGEAPFMDFAFYVDERCLIPRPETELLVEKVLEFLGRTPKFSLLDIGTGSGNIAVSLARYCGFLSVTATDISPESLEVARKNAERLGVADRIQFFVSDLFCGLKHRRFDVIVSNPPYVSEAEMKDLDSELKREPYGALCGGRVGDETIGRLFGEADDFLKPDGTIFIEIGFSQTPAVRSLCAENGFKVINIFKDYNGLDRIVEARRNG